jgi:hypothetical protein
LVIRLRNLFFSSTLLIHHQPVTQVDPGFGSFLSRSFLSFISTHELAILVFYFSNTRKKNSFPSLDSSIWVVRSKPNGEEKNSN